MDKYDFGIGERVRVLRYGLTRDEGREGKVVDHDRHYVCVLLDDALDSTDYTLFLPNEIEKIQPVEPVVDTADDTIDPEDYGIRLRDLDGYADCFEYFHKPSGKVLLTTQFVSVSTLLLIAEDHKEGSR